MGTGNYELMWAELKGEKMDGYVYTYKMLRKGIALDTFKSDLFFLDMDLRKMDEMDGTNEFEELKLKMEREER